MIDIDILKKEIENISNRLLDIEIYLNIDVIKETNKGLEKELQSLTLWEDKEHAQEIINTFNDNKTKLEKIEKIKTIIKEIEEYYEILDESIYNDVLKIKEEILKDLESLELYSYLSGELDNSNIYFSIHAGEGGTEACDWTSMINRMYLRYFEKVGFKYECIDYQDGQEAGIKSITYRVIGKYAYGYLKGEKGVHRLVRISPFDSNARRHTSFCSVDIIPEISKDIKIEIDPKDIRTDVYRSSGHGGQSVNTTDSAVRVTHYPTGIVICCQNERSQIKNRDIAMNILRSKLYELELEKKKAEEEKIRGIKVDNGWGYQIRSYVFTPYQMVKDLRTNKVTSDIESFMDGNIEEFIDSYLKYKGK